MSARALSTLSQCRDSDHPVEASSPKVAACSQAEEPSALFRRKLVEADVPLLQRRRLQSCRRSRSKRDGFIVDLVSLAVCCSPAS